MATTPVFLPGESQGQQRLVGCHLWGRTVGHNWSDLAAAAALIVNKRVQNAVLGCNLKKDRMISLCFQGKPFNITVIQVYSQTTNAKEAEVEQFYEDLETS